MAKVIVTGASGFLGGEVARQAEARGWPVTGTYLTRAVRDGVVLDVRDGAAVDDLATRIGPDVIVHTAYVRRGPASYGTIVDGTAHVAAAAAARGIRLVHVSTDLVFGGRAERYDVDDEPDPVDDYGRAKAAAERLVLGLPGAVIVRSSLLYSVRRACDAVRMVANDEYPFFVDEYRCPTAVEDLAAALLDLAVDGRTGIVHVNAAESSSRYEFAVRVARWLGLPVEHVRAASVADHPEPRPTHVVLRPTIACRAASDVFTSG